MTANFWTTLPGIITALGGAIVAFCTFLLSNRKSHHEEYEQLYGEMKKERDEYYKNWQSEVKKNIRLEKEQGQHEQSTDFHRKN